MNPEILKFNEKQEPNHKKICDVLAEEIDRHLPGSESELWHAHPMKAWEG